MKTSFRSLLILKKISDHDSQYAYAIINANQLSETGLCTDSRTKYKRISKSTIEENPERI